MANRRFNQFCYSFETQPVKIWMNVSFGSSGAPTLTSGQNKGISSISRASAGLYRITLQDNYNRLLAAQVSMIEDSGVPDAPIAFVVDDSVDAGTIDIQFNAASGASGALQATDPGSGEIALIELTLKNSSV